MFAEWVWLHKCAQLKWAYRAAGILSPFPGDPWCWRIHGYPHNIHQPRAAAFKLLGDICCYRSTRCSFPLTACHTTSGWRVPRDTWCCLWTDLTPPALLLPSITLFMCVLMQPTANIDASSGFDATNGLYAFLKYIFQDIRKDRCGRIRRCEWRAVQGSEVIMSGVISSVSFLAKAYIMAVMMFKRTAAAHLWVSPFVLSVHLSVAKGGQSSNVGY